MTPETPQVESKTKDKAVKVAVRYGYLGFVGEFDYSGGDVLLPGKPVLIETDRGLELGWFLCYTSPVDNGFQPNRQAIERYLRSSGQEYLRRKAGKVLRPANEQDLREDMHIRTDSAEKKKYCAETAERFGLKMKIVAVEHLFGGERIIFYFAAEGRIDFRDLVRDLAQEYQTRIELRQIGARDEARLLADYEICGRECCCRNFLKLLRPVNMKMAKLQKATLDPSKVSGRCGRLRCCLAYEHHSYEQLAANLPKVGAWVRTEQGVGRVRDRHILTQLVHVAFGDNRSVVVPVEELSVTDGPESPKDGESSSGPPRRSSEPSVEVPTDDTKPKDQAEQRGDRPDGSRRRRRRKNRRSRRKDSESA